MTEDLCPKCGEKLKWTVHFPGGRYKVVVSMDCPSCGWEEGE